MADITSSPRPIGPLIQWLITWRGDDGAMYGTTVYATDEQTIIDNLSKDLPELRVDGKWQGSVDT